MTEPAPENFPAPESDAPEHLPDPTTLRVAIYSDSLPERNGAGAYYHDLAEQLGSRIGALQLCQPADKKRLLKIFALPLPGDKTQKLITPNVFRISRMNRELRPHLIISVTPGPFGLLGLYHASRAKVGFITAFHTHFEGLVQMYGKGVLDRLFYRVAFWYLEQVNKLLCRRSQTVLLNNDDLIPTVRRLGAPKVDIMGTPLAANFLKEPLAPPPDGLEQVLFAGRLAPEKNLPVVLEAARALPDIRFVMVGDGPLRKEMETAAAELPNLRLTGWLNREELRKEMDAANLLLLPSHMETFGTVALEAMSRGRPALVAENAGIHQWTQLKEALIVLKKGDSVASVLGELRQRPPAYWHTTAAAARKAAEQLNNETIDQWVGFVREYAKPRRDEG